MKIYKIEFDWTGKEEWGFCSNYEVGKKGVKDIGVHSAQGDGDKWYWIVQFDDGHEEMIFNINAVFLTPSHNN